MSADSAEVTATGLHHMGSLHKLDVLRLSGPAARLLNVTMLGSPQKLEVLQLGLLDGPQEEGISAAAVTRSVREWRAMHTPTGNYPQPKVDILTHSP